LLEAAPLGEDSIPVGETGGQGPSRSDGGSDDL